MATTVGDNGPEISNAATVTLTITGVNDAPAAADITTGVLKDGPPRTVTALFLDPDIGDMHTFSVDTTTDATIGKVTDNGDGLRGEHDTVPGPSVGLDAADVFAV